MPDLQKSSAWLGEIIGVVDPPRGGLRKFWRGAMSLIIILLSFCVRRSLPYVFLSASSV